MSAHQETPSVHTRVRDGKLTLGTWQALYVWEHRAHGRTRELVVHVAGDTG